MNDAHNKIWHEGVIQSIDGQHVTVRIEQTSACAACKIASHCNASERKVKAVDVYTAQTAGLSVGQQVTVWAWRSTAAKALLYGFGWPFVVMVGVLTVVLWLTGSEAMAALAALAALAPYYTLLYLLRRRISAGVAFHIET